MTIWCREIHTEDSAQVINLLAHGFAHDRRFRTRQERLSYWGRVMQCLEKRATPPGLPKYGYCLEASETIVGVVLLIFTIVDGLVRCNVSSWYVDPGFRSYGAILASRATGRKDATYFNLSPAPHTWQILERQGFSSYACGRFIAVPALSRSPGNVHIIPFVAGPPDPMLSLSEIEILRDHARQGGMSLVCVDGDEQFPFIFHLRPNNRTVPIARLIYCRSVANFARFAGPLGWYLLLRGFALVICDADAPVAGLIGKYFKGKRRYWKGVNPMRLGDLAYSEMVMFR